MSAQRPSLLAVAARGFLATVATNYALIAFVILTSHDVPTLPSQDFGIDLIGASIWLSSGPMLLLCIMASHACDGRRASLYLRLSVVAYACLLAIYLTERYHAANKQHPWFNLTTGLFDHLLSYPLTFELLALAVRFCEMARQTAHITPAAPGWHEARSPRHPPALLKREICNRLHRLIERRMWPASDPVELTSEVHARIMPAPAGLQQRRKPAEGGC